MNQFYNNPCTLCPRLVDYRRALQKSIPDGWNAPVEGFGDTGGQLLIVGLAPGKMGANRTSRPFTGDDAGNLLYATLLKFGLASGTYEAHAEDSLTLKNCRIINAVKCVPPENKPTAAEINTCRQFLKAEIAAMTRLKTILCLGKISHDSVLKALDLRLADYPFRHAAVYETPTVTLCDSYHCSRYNTNTRRLTAAMFEDVFATIKNTLKA